MAARLPSSGAKSVEGDELRHFFESHRKNKREEKPGSPATPRHPGGLRNTFGPYYWGTRKGTSPITYRTSGKGAEHLRSLLLGQAREGLPRTHPKGEHGGQSAHSRNSVARTTRCGRRAGTARPVSNHPTGVLLRGACSPLGARES